MSKVQTYRKKPLDVPAVKFDAIDAAGEKIDSEWADLEEFTTFLVRRSYTDGATHYFVFDRLHNTWVEFYPGDYILKGSEGEFYPHKGSLFEENYALQGARETPKPGPSPVHLN